MPLQHRRRARGEEDHGARQAARHADALARRRRGAGRRRRRGTSATACSRTSTSTLFTHVGNNLGVSWGDGGGNGLVSVEYTFKGETAHSAGAPWRGRSALDAVELMNVGWNYRREHLRLSQRSHYVITNGGDQPNVVPRNASVWYYFRETDSAAHQGAVGHRQQDGRGRGADDQHHVDLAHPRHGLSAAHEQDRGRDDVREHPDGRPADSGARPTRRWPRRCRRSWATPTRRAWRPKLGELGRPGDARRTTCGGGSDDIGDISWNVPTVTLRYPVQHPRPARPQLVERHRHGDADRAQGRGRRRQGAGDDGARPADASPSSSTQAWDYFNNVQTKDVKYIPFITKDTPPPTHLNTKILAKYREQMKKYYYDPTKYKTYLEQLGIKYRRRSGRRGAGRRNNWHGWAGAPALAQGVRSP